MDRTVLLAAGVVVLGLLALAAVCVGGCARGGATRAQTPRPPNSASSESVPASGPSTVVTLSPAVTEIVFALGQGKRVIGVSDFVTYPEEAKALPSLGGYINPNLEVLRTLSPDLVIYQGMADEVQRACQSMGQAFLSVRLDTIEDVWQAIDLISAHLGCEADGDRLTRDLKAELDAVRAAVAGAPPVRVFVSAGREPGRVEGVMTCAKGTFLDELVAVAGGDNVFHDAPGLYPSPSLEQIVRTAPEAIIDLQPGADAATVEDCAKDWRQLGPLRAVTDGRVLVVTDEYLLTPGPRLTQSARRLARLLHPEVVIDEP